MGPLIAPIAAAMVLVAPLAPRHADADHDRRDDDGDQAVGWRAELLAQLHV